MPKVSSRSVGSQPQAPSDAAPAGTYRVKENDTLTAIAKRHGISLAALEAANPELGAASRRHGKLQGFDYLEVNQVIHIPSADSGAEPQPTAGQRPFTPAAGAVNAPAAQPAATFEPAAPGAPAAPPAGAEKPMTPEEETKAVLTLMDQKKLKLGLNADGKAAFVDVATGEQQGISEGAATLLTPQLEARTKAYAKELKAQWNEPTFDLTQLAAKYGFDQSLLNQDPQANFAMQDGVARAALAGRPTSDVATRLDQLGVNAEIKEQLLQSHKELTRLNGIQAVPPELRALVDGVKGAADVTFPLQEGAALNDSQRRVLSTLQRYLAETKILVNPQVWQLDKQTVTLLKSMATKPTDQSLTLNAEAATDLLRRLALNIPNETKLSGDLILSHPAITAQHRRSNEAVDPTRLVAAYLKECGEKVDPANPKLDAAFFAALDRTAAQPLDEAALDRAAGVAKKLSGFAPAVAERLLTQQVDVTGGATTTYAVGEPATPEQVAQFKGRLASSTLQARERVFGSDAFGDLPFDEPVVALRLALSRQAGRPSPVSGREIKAVLTGQEMRELQAIALRKEGDAGPHLGKATRAQWDQVIAAVDSGQVALSNLKDVPGATGLTASVNAVLADLRPVAKALTAMTMPSDAITTATAEQTRDLRDVEMFANPVEKGRQVLAEHFNAPLVGGANVQSADLVQLEALTKQYAEAAAVEVNDKTSTNTRELKRKAKAFIERMKASAPQLQQVRAELESGKLTLNEKQILGTGTGQASALLARQLLQDGANLVQLSRRIDNDGFVGGLKRTVIQIRQNLFMLPTMSQASSLNNVADASLLTLRQELAAAGISVKKAEAAPAQTPAPAAAPTDALTEAATEASTPKAPVRDPLTAFEPELVRFMLDRHADLIGRTVVDNASTGVPSAIPLPERAKQVLEAVLKKMPPEGWESLNLKMDDSDDVREAKLILQDAVTRLGTSRLGGVIPGREVAAAKLLATTAAGISTENIGPGLRAAVLTNQALLFNKLALTKTDPAEFSADEVTEAVHLAGLLPLQDGKAAAPYAENLQSALKVLSAAAGKGITVPAAPPEPAPGQAADAAEAPEPVSAEAQALKTIGEILKANQPKLFSKVGSVEDSTLSAHMVKAAANLAGTLAVGMKDNPAQTEFAEDLRRAQKVLNAAANKPLALQSGIATTAEEKALRMVVNLKNEMDGSVGATTLFDFGTLVGDQQELVVRRPLKNVVADAAPTRSIAEAALDVGKKVTLSQSMEAGAREWLDKAHFDLSRVGETYVSVWAQFGLVMGPLINTQLGIGPFVKSSSAIREYFNADTEDEKQAAWEKGGTAWREAATTLAAFTAYMSPIGFGQDLLTALANGHLDEAAGKALVMVPFIAVPTMAALNRVKGAREYWAAYKALPPAMQATMKASFTQQLRDLPKNGFRRDFKLGNVSMGSVQAQPMSAPVEAASLGRRVAAKGSQVKGAAAAVAHDPKLLTTRPIIKTITNGLTRRIRVGDPDKAGFQIPKDLRAWVEAEPNGRITLSLTRFLGPKQIELNNRDLIELGKLKAGAKIPAELSERLGLKGSAGRQIAGALHEFANGLKPVDVAATVRNPTVRELVNSARNSTTWDVSVNGVKKSLTLNNGDLVDLMAKARDPRADILKALADKGLHNHYEEFAQLSSEYRHVSNWSLKHAARGARALAKGVSAGTPPPGLLGKTAARTQAFVKSPGFLLLAAMEGKSAMERIREVSNDDSKDSFDKVTSLAGSAALGTSQIAAGVKAAELVGKISLGGEIGMLGRATIGQWLVKPLMSPVMLGDAVLNTFGEWVVGKKSMTAAGGFLSGHVWSGAQAMWEVGKSVVTGDSSGMDKWSEEVRSGEKGALLRSAIEAGDYWSARGWGGFAVQGASVGSFIGFAKDRFKATGDFFTGS
jgi:LysM domain